MRNTTAKMFNLSLSLLSAVKFGRSAKIHKKVCIFKKNPGVLGYDVSVKYRYVYLCDVIRRHIGNLYSLAF